MSRVSYQAMLATHPPPEYRPLESGAIATRRKDATVRFSAKLSRPQARWIREVEAASGKGVDAGALVRGLVDLCRELDIDWTAVKGAAELRESLRTSVLVRR